MHFNTTTRTLLQILTQLKALTDSLFFSFSELKFPNDTRLRSRRFADKTYQDYETKLFENGLFN